MACFFSMPFSNNPYITPWGIAGPDGMFTSQEHQDVGYPYHVQPEETLFSIARRLEVRLQDILAANHGIDPYSPGIGQTIWIPACPPDHSVRYIQPEDTLNGISREYNTSIDSILEANPGTGANYLGIGQRLCIPRYSRHGMN